MADQSWVVFLDGVAQQGVLPYAGSEENALSMWREQTGRRRIARARLRAVPKAEDRAATIEEQTALRAWANEEGPRWKDALRLAWETGNYGGSEHDAALQRIMNRLGPSWLVKYRLPVDPGDETKDYHCWVVTSRNPHQTRDWVATRRADAVSQVKAAVRNHRTEGGVESRDPKRPFEATFSLVRGKLVTTKFTD